MNSYFSLQQPHIRAKIIGLILIILGVVLLLSLNALYMKLGFSSLLIGLFMVFIITEKSAPETLCDAHIEGNLDAVKTITKELNLAGNAVFLPRSNILSEERVFIPLAASHIRLPQVDDETVFSTGSDGKSLGISIPPSGLRLLREMEKETDFTMGSFDAVEEKLQTFVGMNLLRSVSIKKGDTSWSLEVDSPLFCTQDQTMCRQYPCSTCSALLVAISRISQKPVWVTDATHTGKKTTFQFTLGE